MRKEQLTSKLEHLEKNDLKRGIFIKGARGNNLKNIDLFIPKNKLVVVTGLSGSGKSSLTIDTLYAEGQRRYVESLSSYARQFLGRMKKPEVDFIKGICPAIAIEQKVSTRNARSTVGTLTEIYDFLRLLFSRIGKTYSPISGQLVRRHEVTDVVDFLLTLEESTRIQLLAPLPSKYHDRKLSKELDLLMQKGYTRIAWKNELYRIEEFAEAFPEWQDKTLGDLPKNTLYILIDRFAATRETENIQRIADSVQTAFQEGEGDCLVDVVNGNKIPFNNRFELDGLTFLDPTPQLFNYNNPYGACPQCEGFGQVMGIDEDKVVPNKSLSLYEGAIAPWRGEKFGEWLNAFLEAAHQFDFPVHKPYRELSKDQRRLLWKGNATFQGVYDFFRELEEKTYKIQNRVMLARYRGRTTCPSCEGGRLRPEARYVKINDHSLDQLVEMNVKGLLSFFQTLQLDDHDAHIARRLVLEVTNRLQFMEKLGLEYLTLNRLSSTLSGGETQRINLTRTLGSNLTSSMYILDEPSIGLHPRDTNRLVSVLRSLRDLGNTVVVVEHEEDIIRNADYLIDIGPGAGIHGGEVVFNGPYQEIYSEAANSLTTGYMSGKLSIPVPKKRRPVKKSIWIRGAAQHNLKNIDVQIPLNTLCVVSGVSGSGKTTLVKQILHPALEAQITDSSSNAPGEYRALEGDLKHIKQIELVNQNPIGKSSRSNPVTYVKAYDAIRNLMAGQQLSKVRGFKPGHFSFNVEGGRCETCKGEGEQIVEMQFLADVRLECEDCKGQRFKQEILDVRYKELNIYQILQLSIEEAMDFFSSEKDIVTKLKPLMDVGLGYVKLGQSSNTLSGGEAQRVKLASFLSKDQSNNPIFFIFDEPTTGLHFHDIRKLLDSLNALVDKGHTVLVVEHNLEVIKTADWIIDLGPEGGEKGGQLLFQGTPEDMVSSADTPTSLYLKEKLP